MDKKAVVIFDTNKLLQNPDDAKYYSKVDLGGDFNKLVSDFLPENFLKDNVVLAIPKICIEEIKQRKVEDLDSKFQSLKSKFDGVIALKEIISNLIDLDIKEPVCKKDCYKYLVTQIDKFVGDNDILLLDLPPENNLKPIIERAISRKPPFKSASNYGPDAGFKDVIVWHSILEHADLKKFDHHIFFTQDTGFDLNCLDEFEKKFGKKIKKAESYEELKEKLLEIYPEEERNKVKVKSKVITPYFKEQLYNEVKGVLEDNKKIRDFKIVNPYVDSVFDEKIGLFVLISKIKIDISKDWTEVIEKDISVYLNDAFDIQSIDESFIYDI